MISVKFHIKRRIIIRRQETILPLERFYALLKLHGFVVTPSQIGDANKIIHEFSLNVPNEYVLGHFLCPIFATDKDQQQTFETLYKQFIQERAVKSPSVGQRIWNHLKQNSLPYILVTVLIGLLSIAKYYSDYKVKNQLNTNSNLVLTNQVDSNNLSNQIAITNTNNKGNTDNITKSDSSTTTQFIDTDTLGIAALPGRPMPKWFFIPPLLILLAIFYFRHTRKAQKNAKKQAPSDLGQIEASFISGFAGMLNPRVLPFKSKNQLPLPEEELSELSWQMRRKMDTDRLYLDIPKTVWKATRSNGLIRPVYSKRAQQTEYLVLIDQNQPKSQLVHVFDYLAEYISKKNVYLTVYYFHDDFTSFSKTAKSAFLTLEQLNVKYPEHILLILSNCHNLLEQHQPVIKPRYLQFIRRWKIRAALTPLSYTDWGNKERKGLHPEFILLPADVQSMLLFGDKLFNPDINVLTELRQLKHFFYEAESIEFNNINDLIKYCNSAEWSTVLEKGKKENILFQWVASIAIYPTIRWEIIIVLGDVILGRYNKGKELNFTNLLRIARIRWFDEGELPDNIRFELLKQLEPGNEVLARQAILKLLSEIPASEVGPSAFAYEEKEIQRVINEFNLFAFNHEVYSAYEPSAKIMKALWSEKKLMDTPMKIYLRNENGKWSTLLRSVDSKPGSLNPKNNISMDAYMEFLDEKTNRPIRFFNLSSFKSFIMATSQSPYLVKSLQTTMNMVSNLSKAAWLFFPSILTILVTLFFFGKTDSGIHLLFKLTEHSGNTKGFASLSSFMLGKFTFFMGLALWAYVCWYSSILVAQCKKNAMQRQQKPRFDKEGFQEDSPDTIQIPYSYLDFFPRLIGYACFLSIGIPVIGLEFESWINNGLPSYFVILIGISYVSDKQLARAIQNQVNSRQSRRWLTIISIAFLASFLITCITGLINTVSILSVHIILLIAIYGIYIHLREKWLSEDYHKLQAKSATRADFSKRSLDFLRIDLKEINYYNWFNIISSMALVVYIANIISNNLSILAGPVLTILLSFSVLLGFSNLVSALSIKVKLPFHFIVLILVVLFTTPENHFVRTVSSNINPDSTNNVYARRQTLQQYFTTWLSQRDEIDSVQSYPCYFVLANGGGASSAYWTSSILAKMEDASLALGKDRFSNHIFCLSGTSGAAVGITSFYAMIKNRNDSDSSPSYELSTKNFLKQDFLSHSIAAMLGPDIFNYLPTVNWLIPNSDRAAAREVSIERALDTAHYKLHYDSLRVDDCINTIDKNTSLPILCINTTRVADGGAAAISTIQLDSKNFNNRIDILSLLSPGTSLRLSTAAVLATRFPIQSPAGRIDQYIRNGVRHHYFVDGSYFNNSGSDLVKDMIEALREVTFSISDPELLKKVKKLQIIVINITSTPQSGIQTAPLSPFVNDFYASLVTNLNTHNFKTSPSKLELPNSLFDFQTAADSAIGGKTVYYPIHLYNDPTEKSDTSSNGPFEQSWFLSDSTISSINRRLITQPKLNRILRNRVY